MLTRRIIPCLDVRDGRVVKGVRFRNLRDAGDPAALAASYEEQGADELVLLDVSATLEGRGALLDTVRAVRRAVGIPVAVGGGVRSRDDARALLQAGADKVAVNSAAVERPGLLAELADTFGRQCVVLAIDAGRTGGPSLAWRVATRAGSAPQELDPAAWAARACALGAGEVLLTSIDRDGTLDGYDLDLIGAVRAAVDVPLIASGGARTPADMRDAFARGADAALAASIFHDARTTVDAVKRGLALLGVEVRT